MICLRFYKYVLLLFADSSSHNMFYLRCWTDGMGFDFVPWQSAWLEQVLWESLNFAVLAAVCVVCRPTGKQPRV